MQRSDQTGSRNGATPSWSAPNPREEPYWEGEGSLGSRSPAFSPVRLPLLGSGIRVEVSCPKLKFII
jgi:hypothetical protein